MRINKYIFFLIVLFGLFTNRVRAQESGGPVNKRLQKRSYVISSHVIYNYFTNKTLVNIVNPYGQLPNSRQIVYYWQYKYYDTYTFDVSLQYKRMVSKSLSLSYGIRCDQMKSLRKTQLYIDSSSHLPDEKRLTDNKYSLSLPVSGNFYLKRFRFSVGVYAYFLTLTKTVYSYEGGLEKKYSDLGFDLAVLAHESVAFKLRRDKGIYLEIGAIQRSKFWRDFGYNNFFTCGLSLEI